MRSATTDALRRSLMNRTVLVIDDNEAVRTAFEVLLSIHGVRTLTAASPAQGGVECPNIDDRRRQQESAGRFW